MTNQIWRMYYFCWSAAYFPDAVNHSSYLHSSDEGQKWSQCDGQIQVEKRRLNRGRRHVRASSKNPRGEVDIWNNNKDHNTLPLFFPYYPSFLSLLSFSPLGLLSIALSCFLLLPLSLLSLRISGGGPLIASLISHVRQLCGFTGDVELLQIIACLFPFSLLLNPSHSLSIPPSSFHCAPQSIPLTHSPMI